MRIGSLCSGVGLLELGLEWAGLGETAWTCEINPFCRRLLHKHWPDARHYEDITRIDAARLQRVDLICFGFPCQDISSAGSQAGLGGTRSGLFYRCAEVVASVRPEWVVVENVASGAKLWVDECRRELERLGYASLPIPIAAHDVGALHRRARIFVIAHANWSGERTQPRQPEVASAPSPSSKAADAHGLALWVNQQRLASRSSNRVRDTRNPVAGFPGWFGPEPDVVRLVHGSAGALDGSGLDAAQRLAALCAEEELDIQKREALGNSVVPWCSEVVGYVIQELRREAALYRS